MFKVGPYRQYIVSPYFICLVISAVSGVFIPLTVTVLITDIYSLQLLFAGTVPSHCPLVLTEHFI